jgi:multicomponent Na+:H+ antiporter subunit E
MRRIALIAWLTALWVILWRDLTVANVASGALVAVTILGLYRLRTLTLGEEAPRAHTLRPLALARFAGWFVYKLVVSNVVVAREIVTPRDTIRSGIIAVPVIGHSDLVTTVVADAISLTPGTLTLEVRHDPPTLYVHVMHLYDPDRVRRDILTLQLMIVRAIGSREAVGQAESAVVRRHDAAGSAGTTTRGATGAAMPGQRQDGADHPVEETP